MVSRLEDDPVHQLHTIVDTMISAGEPMKGPNMARGMILG